MRIPNRRGVIVLVLCCLVPLGLGTKFYSGPLENWVHSFAGDIFYPLFWLFLLFLIKPDITVLNAAVMVFTGCVLIEFTQLFSNRCLQIARSFFLGRTLVGTHFSMMDILYYAIGCIFGAIFYHIIKKVYPESNDRQTPNNRLKRKQQFDF